MTDRKNIKLTGTCDLISGESNYRRVLCEVDFINGELLCLLPGMNYGDIPAFHNSAITLKNVELNSLNGLLTAHEVEVAFATSVGGGGWSNDQTDLGRLVGIKPQLTSLSVVLNKPLTLSSVEIGNEIIFYPAFETVGKIELEDGISIVGGKEYVSVLGENSMTVEQLSMCVSVVLGAPAMPAIIHKGSEVKIFLNHFKRAAERPMFFQGWPFHSTDAVREGTKELFVAVARYIKSLNSAEYAKFSNATNTFMQTRVSNQSIELKLLGTFYFLEWLDGSRRMSENELVKVLSICRAEADVIKKVRDELVHNCVLLSDVIVDAALKLRLLANSEFSKFETANDFVSFTNYLVSIVSKSFLTKIGFTGEVEPFFPIHDFYTITDSMNFIQ